MSVISKGVTGGVHIQNPPSRTVRRLILVLLDSGAWATAMFLATALRYELDLQEINLQSLQDLILITVVAQILIGQALPVYRGRHCVGRLDDAISVTAVVACTGLAVTTLNIILEPTLAPRSVPVIAAPIAALLAVGARLVVRLRRERWTHVNRSSSQRVIVYGASVEGEQLLRTMLSDPLGGYLPVALLDDDPRLSRLRISGVPVQGTRADIRRAVAESQADLLVITDRSADRQSIKEISEAAFRLGLDVRLAPPLTELLQPLPLDLAVEGMRTAGTRPELPPRVARSRAKRLLDVALCCIAIPLVLPLMLLIAVALALVDKQVIYRAERVGRNGQPFTMYKFATMAAADDGPRVTRAGDLRITQLGRWLRASKLNELPQVINVLKGDMSLVGPRPEDPRYEAFFSERQREVLAARPGMTSAAFLAFGDEEKFIELVQPTDIEAYYLTDLLPRKLEIEMRYIREWTLLADLQILARTFSRLLVWQSTSRL
jgi:lipopolysaccharide/colanic/teichoic acid biosynthesis glycosyltransferase